MLAQSLSVALSGKASDLEDGDLTARITWSSSLDGALGVGGSLAAKLSPGSHTITASVADSAGATTRSSVSLLVPAPNLLVTVASDASTLRSSRHSQLDRERGGCVGLAYWSSSQSHADNGVCSDREPTGHYRFDWPGNNPISDQFEAGRVGIYSVKVGASPALAGLPVPRQLIFE